MSTWRPVWSHVEDYEGNPLVLVSKSEWGIVPRAAFEALLAVAKAAGSAQDNPGWVFDMSDALIALDAAHPNWRDWEDHHPS